MRKYSVLSLVFVMLFMFSLADLSGNGTPLTDQGLLQQNQSQVSDAGGSYMGTGSPLTVSFSGTFVNSSSWSQSTTTLSSDFTSGTSFVVSNASTVTWTAYILVSPPPEVQTLGFTVDYPNVEWIPVSLTNPVGVVETYLTDWWYDNHFVYVSNSAVTTYGLWKLEFTAMNHLLDLELGPSSGSLGTTSTFDLSDEMLFRGTSTWITGSSTKFVLTDPTGSEWYTSENITSGSTQHLLQSFKYRRTFTIDRTKHLSLSVNNFPVMIDITDPSLSTKVQSDGDDIVFVSGSNILSHQIELFNPATGHLIAWVKANLTGSSNTQIVMYYGNPLFVNMENSYDVWTESFAAVWHLNEDTTAGQTTGIHYDSTSGGYDGTQSGNFDDTGRVGLGQHFDGSNDQIIIPSSESLEPNGDVEISGWFKPDITHNSLSTTTKLLFTKMLDGDNDMHIALVGTDYSTAAAPDGSLVFKTENGANGQMYKWTARTTWTAGVWYYFSCFMDASTPSNNRITINGVVDTAGSSGGITYADLSFTADWGIGGGLIDQVAGTYAWFDGVMDEVRVSSTTSTVNGRPGEWRAADYANLNSPSTFYSVGSEVERVSPDPQIKKTADASALAGTWTVSAYYNDSGSSVGYRVGMYERTFVIRHSSSLALTAPTNAVSDSITEAIIGDALYVQVELTDDITSSGITSATVTTNWTLYGSKIDLQFHDEGGGRYGIVLNTSQLEDNVRWRLNIESSHPYYTLAEVNLYIDLSHDTSLGFTNVDSTPTGFDFTATLIYTDTFDGSPISGATITFANGTLANVVAATNGEYNISLSTTGLSIGAYSFIFNATKPGSLLEMASVRLTFILRPHYTAASVSGDLITPYGFNTHVTVVLVDLDTGGSVGISKVASITFTPSGYGQQVFGTFTPTLVTNSWGVANVDVTLTIALSSSDYYAPDPYDFQITIRKHYTSATVLGNLVTPYGNNTPVTIKITDLDTGGTVLASALDYMEFDSSYPLYFLNSPIASLDVLVPTGSSSWSVGVESVTLRINMLVSSIYQNPSDYVFQITIRSMATYLYNEPSDLIFPNGDDFNILLHLNVSEVGPNYGNPINGLATDFVIRNSTYTYPAVVVGLGNGVYNLTIGASYFPEGTYTIRVTVTPSDSRYAITQLVITFNYRPTRSDLTANIYTVSTPYDHDVTVTLFYEDLDRGLGITIGVITSLDAPITPVPTGGGYYDVTIDVTGLPIGSHLVTLDANATGYDPRSVTITIIITKIHTDAEPSLVSLDMPVGNTKIFYIDFNDLDNGVPISSATVTNNWTVQLNVVVSWTGTRWQVSFATTGSDPLGTYIVWFNFDEGSGNYYDGYCEIEVVVRSHVTIFNLVSAIEPTPYDGTMNISLRYYDWDSKTGITDGSNILSRVWNQTNWIPHTLVNDGGGFYTVQISASLFSQGVQNFVIYFDWIGPVQQFENKTTTASGNIIGIDSQLTLLQASEPTPYLGSLLYVFNYAETSGTGITNSSYGGGNVHIFVNFQGESVDLSQVTITELGTGNYSISFSSTIFGRTGLIYMSVYINWSAGVAPFYTNRFDVISVRILPRDTVLAVSPPTPQAYGENATFTFTFEDVTGGGNVPIDAAAALTVSSSLADYALSWNGLTHEFTFSFDTSQFGAPLGQKSFTLSVTWAGAPYYTNRTGRNVFVTITARQTLFDYESPAPTAYQNNVTINLEWTDVSGAAPRGIEGATVTLYNSIFPIPSIYYTVREMGNGIYEVELDTTAYSIPATYELTIEMAIGVFYIDDASSMRYLNVLYRPSLLSAEPIGPAPYNSSLVYILDFQDRLTLTTINNDTSRVTLTILNGSSWFFTVEWKPAFQYYVLTIDTYNHPELTIGPEYTLRIEASYASQAPFYASDDTYIFFELRTRSSIVTLVESPDPTPYLESSQFRVRYVDSDSGQGIIASSIFIYKGATPLTAGVNYTLTNQGNGYYLISLETTALNGLGYTTIQVRAVWSGGVPYHNNATLDVNVYVTRREANVEIVTPPTQVRFLDNITLQFVYRDLGSGSIITSITATNIEIWASGTLLLIGQYQISGVSGTFTLGINSTVLSPSLVSNYNLTIRVDWNDASPPYYYDDSTIARLSTRGRSMSYSVLPAESTAFGELLNLSFTLLDADSSNPVINAQISFNLKSGGLVEGVDFIVIKGIGVYTIQLDTTALGTPGTYQFDLDIGWDGSSPYYLGLSTITMTGVVSKIDTLFVPLQELVTEQWQSSASITLNYTSALDGSPVLGASMKWIWNEAFIYAGPAGEIGGGLYQAAIDTSLAVTGTYVITFVIENLTAYKSAVAYVTLVITKLDSDLTVIDPAVSPISISRGAPLPITIYLTDGSNNPILDSYHPQVLATLDGLYSFVLTYTGTPGYYSCVLPADDETATKRAPQTSYDVILSATIDNYYPAASSFTFLVLQTKTAVQLGINTTDEMTFVYSEQGLISVNIVLPENGSTPFWNGTVQWSISDLGLTATFTNNFGNGTFSTLINTTLIGYGIVPLNLRFNPWPNMSLYTSSSKLITLAITRIQTSATPPSGREFYWGWQGNLTFVYWSESFEVGIPGADVTLTLPGFQTAGAFDLGNGTYLVYLDTSQLRASLSYLPMTVSFSKANHLTANAVIQIRILEVPTEIAVQSVDYTPAYSGTLLDLINLQIPIGDSMSIDFLYNDTDNSDGFIGGLGDAISTANSKLRGPTIDTPLDVTIIPLGDGLYRVVFDTMDSAIAAQVDPDVYTIYIEMVLGNRSASSVLFKIEVINIPSELVFLDTPPSLMTNGETITLDLLYNDTWHNLGIKDAAFSTNVSAGSPFSASIAAGSIVGHYLLTINTRGIMFGPGSGTVIIRLGAESYSIGAESLFIEVLQNDFDMLVTTGVTWGLPIGLIIALIGGAYVRVWSVPKKLRKLNSQIKAIKKGKVPKPAKDVKSRQQLIADLFNDTYEKMTIVRTADAFPEESIPVEVPELGGLLIQLAILTNLNQQELDEFKADIAKMKLSEQAAFVKEVIMQEAIRAARREGKDVDEVLSELRKEAQQRLAGEEVKKAPAGEAAEELEEAEEPVFLIPEEEGPETEPTTSAVELTPLSEEISFTSDELSPFEIEELKKELLEKGIPMAEVDTILKQVEGLPRELVEELIRSLDAERLRKS
jgi:hypothetical protein